VKGRTGQRVRLYVRGTILGYKRWASRRRFFCVCGARIWPFLSAVPLMGWWWRVVVGLSRTSTRPRRWCRSRGWTPRRTSRGTPASAWRTSTRPRPRAARRATGASGARSPARTATPASSAPSSSPTSRRSPWSVIRSLLLLPLRFVMCCLPIDAVWRWSYVLGAGTQGQSVHVPEQHLRLASKNGWSAHIFFMLVASELFVCDRMMW